MTQLSKDPRLSCGGAAIMFGEKTGSISAHSQWRLFFFFRPWNIFFQLLCGFLLVVCGKIFDCKAFTCIKFSFIVKNPAKAISCGCLRGFVCFLLLGFCFLICLIPDCDCFSSCLVCASLQQRSKKALEVQKRCFRVEKGSGVRYKMFGGREKDCSIIRG